MANPEEHVVGPPEGTIRSVGSTTQPARNSRIRFTEDDDRKLWSWVQDHPQKGGGTDGNEIYKQLEAAVSRKNQDPILEHAHTTSGFTTYLAILEISMGGPT